MERVFTQLDEAYILEGNLKGEEILPATPEQEVPSLRRNGPGTAAGDAFEKMI